MQFRNRVLSGLTSDQLSRIGPSLSEVSLARGEIIHERDEWIDALYFPVDAVISVVTVMEDGRSVETTTIGNESVAGALSALAGLPAHTRTFAQIAGGALRLPVRALTAAVSADPTLLKALLLHIHKDVAQAEQSVACNAIHTAGERLARWLLLTHDRVGAPTFKLTQEYLAIMLGVQRTTVTREAMILKDLGMISYVRGRVEIIDREALEGASCECYAANRQSLLDADDRARAIAASGPKLVPTPPSSDRLRPQDPPSEF